MNRFSDIYGQKEIKEHLQKAIAMDKVSHAYILNGGNGAGKKQLAALFARTLQCENPQKDGQGNAEPCNSCHSCIQADSGNQPDIIWVRHEKPASIGVDDIREQLVEDIQIKPYSSRYKIYIVDEAEKMTTQAQNALLKTIEEPPAYGIILLLTTNAGRFLDTILSRCVLLDLKPVSDELVLQYLKDTYSIVGYEARFATAFAQGRIGRAITIATTSEFAELKQEVLRVVKHTADMAATDLMQSVKKAAAYKLTADDYLDLMAMWYRDVLLFKSTRDGNGLIFKEEITFISEQANKCSYQGLEQILEAIDKVKVRLQANVSFELAVELLLLTIRENMN